MLRLDLKPGDSVRIGADVLMRLEEKTGRAARLAFDAPASVRIRMVRADKAEVDPLRGIAHAAA